MMTAELESVWATCMRKRVGTIFTDPSGAILSTGRNGSPSKRPHCNKINNTIDWRCPFCIHSEKNGINHAARRGISLKGSFVYTLYRPCISCANDLAAVQIGSLYYRWDYDSDSSDTELHPDMKRLYGSARNYVRLTLEECGVYVEQLTMSEAEHEFSEYIEQFSAKITYY